MNIKIYFFLFLSLIVQLSFAQQIDTIWYNNKWEKTLDRSARHYARHIETISSTNFLVKDFYETNALQMQGYYSSLNPEVKNGNFTYWYRTGKIQMENTYHENKLMRVIQYRENGDITNRWETVVIGKDKDGKDIIRTLEVAPKFPGGTESMNEFIKNNINFPLNITNKHVSGKVIVKFTVDPTGNIVNVQVIQKLHPLLDKEAIAVVKKMPKWEPGKQDGKFVAIQMTIPIFFEGSNP